MALITRGLLQEIRKIHSGLKAEEVRKSSTRTLRIGLAAGSEEGFRTLEQYLFPSPPETAGQERALDMAVRVSLDDTSTNGAKSCDFVLCEPRISLGPIPENGYRFDIHDPDATTEAILVDQEEIELALGRNFAPFRERVASRIIQRIATENALFSMASALPNVVPNLLELPWVVGEFATDTAFITMNQVRMALQLAAIYERPVGYMDQKVQLAAIAGGAFGWRALARELVGKIPLGGGLIPKAAISFAGTWVVGLGLERANRLGHGLSARERRDLYLSALERGKEVARRLVPDIRRIRSGHA